MRKTVFPVQVKSSLINGLGVFATKAFKKGDFIGIASGWVPETIDDNCSYTISFDNVDDSNYGFIMEPTAPFCYMNHSKDPNAEMVQGPVIFAVKNISIGEEITISYGDDWGE